MMALFNCKPLRQMAQQGWRNYSKMIKFGGEARRLIVEGAEAVKDHVALTMGPKGGTVVVSEGKEKTPRFTKEGHMVAKQLRLRDRFHDMGSQLIIQVAEDANNEAGDGTTTTTLLASAIAKEAQDALTGCRNPHELRAGIKIAVECVCGYLKKVAKPVETILEIEQMATAAASGDFVVGQMIARALDKVGWQGVVRLRDGTSRLDQLQIFEGFQFDKGYISQYFINTDKASARVEHRDCYVLLCNSKISASKPLIPVLEMAKNDDKPLLIIAEDIQAEGLAILVLNRMAGMDVVAVKTPGFGPEKEDLLRDIAAITGATIFGEGERGALVSKLKGSDLGRVGQVHVSNEETLLLDFKGPREGVEGRVAQVRTELENAKDDLVADRLHNRLGRLTSGVAIIHVGGYAPVEVSVRKDKYIDAMNATKSALKEGLLAGGGTALLKSIKVLDALPTSASSDTQRGIEVIKKSLRAPCFTLMQNAQVEDASVIIEKIIQDPSDTKGFDVVANKMADMLESGILDSAKMVRVALQRAASVSSLIASSEAVIVFAPGDHRKVHKFY